jgi:antitoxin (DNA-binding transcriptional repressor) of toxin-antitoxin stability system
MTQVNMREAKTLLSRLVESLVKGSGKEVTISRNGRPAVRMTKIENERPKRVFGFAKGRFEFNDGEFQALDAEVQAMFDEGIEKAFLAGACRWASLRPAIRN